MALATRPWAADILHFWFRELRPAQWFRSDPAVDAACARRFGHRWEALRRRPAREFLRDRHTARAAILLFDQIPRNTLRDTAQAFASDPLARTITRGALARGWDRGLSRPERQFLAMPLMHSEAIADQRRSIQVYAGLGSASVLSFARAHYDDRPLRPVPSPQCGAGPEEHRCRVEGDRGGEPLVARRSPAQAF